MDKEVFLQTLRAEISGLPQEDAQRSLEFYREAIEDRIEGGLTEEEAVEALGPVEEITEQILSEMPLPKLIRAKVSPGRSLRTWEIVLLILGSPVWFSLMLAAAAVALALYLIIWSLLIAIYAVVLTFAVSGIVFLFRGFGHLMATGLGMMMIGLPILVFLAANKAAKLVMDLSKR